MASFPLVQFPAEQRYHFRDASSASSDRPRVVVIDASASSLTAVGIILAALVADFPVPILIVQHSPLDFPSQIVPVLGGLTSLRVKQAEEGCCLQAGHVYIAQPGTHLRINMDLSLWLSVSNKFCSCCPAADVLFRSAAVSCGPRAVGVVLAGGEGSAGLQAIKAAGGVTIAQAPTVAEDSFSSQLSGVPHHASPMGDLDFVLSLPEIAPALVALVRPGKALACQESKTDLQGAGRSSCFAKSIQKSICNNEAR